MRRRRAEPPSLKLFDLDKNAQAGQNGQLPMVDNAQAQQQIMADAIGQPIAVPPAAGGGGVHAGQGHPFMAAANAQPGRVGQPAGAGGLFGQGGQAAHEAHSAALGRLLEANAVRLMPVIGAHPQHVGVAVGGHGHPNVGQQVAVGGRGDGHPNVQGGQQVAVGGRGDGHPNVQGGQQVAVGAGGQRVAVGGSGGRQQVAVGGGGGGEQAGDVDNGAWQEHLLMNGDAVSPWNQGIRVHGPELLNGPVGWARRGGGRSSQGRGGAPLLPLPPPPQPPPPTQYGGRARFVEFGRALGGMGVRRHMNNQLLPEQHEMAAVRAAMTANWVHQQQQLGTPMGPTTYEQLRRLFTGPRLPLPPLNLAVLSVEPVRHIIGANGMPKPVVNATLVVVNTCETVELAAFDDVPSQAISALEVGVLYTFSLTRTAPFSAFGRVNTFSPLPYRIDFNRHSVVRPFRQHTAMQQPTAPATASEHFYNFVANEAPFPVPDLDPNPSSSSSFPQVSAQQSSSTFHVSPFHSQVPSQVSAHQSQMPSQLTAHVSSVQQVPAFSQPPQLEPQAPSSSFQQVIPFTQQSQVPSQVPVQQSQEHPFTQQSHVPPFTHQFHVPSSTFQPPFTHQSQMPSVQRVPPFSQPQEPQAIQPQVIQQGGGGGGSVQVGGGEPQLSHPQVIQQGSGSVQPQVGGGEEQQFVQQQPQQQAEEVSRD